MSELALVESHESTVEMPVKAAQCFADYVELGPQRSLRKLLAKYVEDGVKSPASIRQLERWSTDYDWQQRLKDIAAGRIDEAMEYRLGTYVAITKKYHKMIVIDEPNGITVPLHATNSIFDRVKPKEPETAASIQPAGGNVLIQFALIEVTGRD